MSARFASQCVRRKRPTISSLLENLESRRLLSSSLDNGLLLVIGTSGNDSISRQYTGGADITVR